MAITINGSGTITGASTLATAVASPTLTTPNIDSAQIPTVSGTAPLYMCRAWVRFNGTSTVAINGSGNVSSITDNGTGDYTINFTTAMSDANYCVSGACRGQNDTDTNSTVFGSGVITTTTARVYVKNNANSVVDSSAVNVAIFR